VGQMNDVIVVAGGANRRNLELANKLENEQYRIKMCRSLSDFRSAYSEGAISSILLLYPDEYGIISEIFDPIIMNGGHTAPIIFISSSLDDNNNLRTLRYEADEFLIEPVSTLDILQAIDGFSRGQHDLSSVLSIGDLALDRIAMTVTLRNTKLPLQPIQARILELLMLNPGRVFTRQQIANGIWGIDGSIDERTIDVTVGRIRDALKHKVTVDPIRTVRSVGYGFNEYFAQISSMPKKGRRVERLRARRVAD
jgi:DNA-binding response OmpR family regulator